ncbi:MAG: hypothetical protein GXO24_02285 [Chlorobi bacterium]|nr:hypothetical protein [Chlorobiota bacterium]
MTKRKRQTKAVQEGKRVGLQIHEEYDDSLLPAPEELKKYKELDPNIIEWIKTRAQKEQEFRHHFQNERLRLTEKQIENEAYINKWGLIFAFLIMLISIPTSAYLILSGMTIAGSILGGVVLSGVVIAFLQKVNGSNKSGL